MNAVEQKTDACPAETTWHDWLIRDEHAPNDDDPLARHLESCEACRASLDRLASRDEFLVQSRSALQATGLSSHDWETSPTENANEPGTHQGVLSVVQSLLGPTDDDQSLGRLGRFEIVGVIGSGGMGIVLKARSIDVDRVVAVKIPQPQYWQSPDTLLTLEREARSAAAVVHPNVISIYHVDRYRDVPYLVMPYLPGESLQQRIQRAGRLSVEESLRILRQLASALAAAHACGVVHRDVKPANILLSHGTDRVVLSDFGLARVQSDATCTATGTFAGTPIYLSPEQASGHRPGPAGDLFSLGTVLWTMLAGHPPMSGMHTHAIVRKVADSTMPDLRTARADLPFWLHRLVDLMHATAPDDRPTAETIARWSEQCQRHLNERGTPLPDELQTSRRDLRVRWPIAIAAACLLVPLLALLVTPEGDSKENIQPTPEPTTAAPSSESNAESEVAQVDVPWPTPSDAKWLVDLHAELTQLKDETLPQWERRIELLESE